MGSKRQIELPEHDKLRDIQPLSQAVYNFLEWCGEQGIVLCDCTDRSNERWYPISMGREKLLARHFEIDLAKLEREKESILAEQRALNEKHARPV